MKPALNRYFAASISFEDLSYDSSFKTLADIISAEKHNRLAYKEYMQGLPSWCRAHYMNYDIVQEMVNCGYRNTNQNRLVEMYWANLARYVETNAHKIKIEG